MQKVSKQKAFTIPFTMIGAAIVLIAISMYLYIRGGSETVPISDNIPAVSTEPVQVSRAELLTTTEISIESATAELASLTAEFNAKNTVDTKNKIDLLQKDINKLNGIFRGLSTNNSNYTQSQLNSYKDQLRETSRDINVIISDTQQSSPTSTATPRPTSTAGAGNTNNGNPTPTPTPINTIPDPLTIPDDSTSTGTPKLIEGANRVY